MPNIVGVRFRNCGRIYDFEIDAPDAHAGTCVVVESDFGLSIGTVVREPRSVDETDREFKKVLRIATDKDIEQKKENEAFERETRDFCVERIMARGLPMKLVYSEVTLDRKRLVFYFTADGRIDFRELVKDLAAKFKTRIEMRQIGVRDKAKMVGGLGLCGRELCCRLFLTTFEPISIKMAKQQELVLNTGKLSGVCGRLMCCLGYEYEEGMSGPPPKVRARERAEAAKAEALPTDAVEKAAKAKEAAPALGPPAPAQKAAEQTAAQEGGQKPKRDRKRRRRKRFKKRTKDNEQ